jgi:hypothetical protein
MTANLWQLQPSLLEHLPFCHLHQLQGLAVLLVDAPQSCSQFEQRTVRGSLLCHLHHVILEAGFVQTRVLRVSYPCRGGVVVLMHRLLL